jgi:hypothetical protein
MHATATDVSATLTLAHMQDWLEKQKAWHRRHFPDCTHELVLTKQT